MKTKVCVGVCVSVCLCALENGRDKVRDEGNKQDAFEHAMHHPHRFSNFVLEMCVHVIVGILKWFCLVDFM